MRIAEQLCMKIFKSKKEREELKAQAELQKLKAKTRTPEDVGKDYGQLAAELGDKSYQVKVLQIEIEELHKKLFALNQEFKTAQIVHAPQTTAQPPAIKPLDQAPAAALEAIAQIPAEPEPVQDAVSH